MQAWWSTQPTSPWKAPPAQESCQFWPRIICLRSSWGKWFCTNILNNFFYLIKIHLNWLLSFHWLPVSGTRGQLSGLDWIWNTKLYATSLWCIKEKWKIKSGAKVDVLTCWGHCAKMMRGSLTMETFDATTFPSNHNNDAWSPDKRSDEVFLGSCIWRDWEPSRDAEEAEPENHWNNFSSMSGWCRNLIKGDVNLVNVWEWWMLQFVKRMSVWWMLPIVILFEKKCPPRINNTMMTRIDLATRRMMRSAEVGLEGTGSAPKSSLKTNYLIWSLALTKQMMFWVA